MEKLRNQVTSNSSMIDFAKQKIRNDKSDSSQEDKENNPYIFDNNQNVNTQINTINQEKKPESTDPNQIFKGLVKYFIYIFRLYSWK